MADGHTELEIKLVADHLDVGPFQEWCAKQDATRFIYVESPDVYWRQGDSVVRHRFGGGAGQLTTKRRRSATSTVDREEVDLDFGPNITDKSVEAFLFAAGFKRDLVLFKRCWIWWIKKDGHEYSIVLYDAEKLDPRSKKRVQRRRYLELEVEKGDVATPKQAQRLLDAWEVELRKWFRLGPRLTESLYEIYSGRRYKQVRKCR